VPDVKSIYRAHKMAYNRLVGLEKGNCAFCACFQVSAAGGFVYARARVRAMFRKQNKVGSDTRKQNKGFPPLFRKLNSVGSV